MTRPGIEPRFPGPLVNTLTIMPMSGVCCKKGTFKQLRMHSANPSTKNWMWHKVIFRRTTVGLKYRFFFLHSLTYQMFKNSIWSTIYPDLSFGGNDGFLWSLNQSEMLTALSKIWLLVADFIFHYDKSLAISAFMCMYIRSYFCILVTVLKYIYIYIYICVCVRIYIYICVCVCVCVLLYM